MERAYKPTGLVSTLSASSTTRCVDRGGATLVVVSGTFDSACTAGTVRVFASSPCGRPPAYKATPTRCAVGLRPCTLQICESSAMACCRLLADLEKWPREPRAA